MSPLCRSPRNATHCLAASAALGTLFAMGCASPGPPRAPSLNLPRPVSDLTATRTGNIVDLRFTIPSQSTDKLPLNDPKHHHTTIRGTLCRQVDRGDCAVVASFQPAIAIGTAFTQQDELPPALTSGQPRVLGYRVEFFNDTGRSAGKSEAAYTASGPAPRPVSALHAEGTRQGILLQWSSAPDAPGEVLLRRVDLNPKPFLKPVSAPAKPVAKPPTRTTRSSGSAVKHSPREDDTWLATNSSEARTLDATVIAGDPYRYTAVRRIEIKLGSRTFDVRSEPSAPVDFTLSATYPPPSPQGLTAAGFQPPTGHFAVDLIWQPVDNGLSSKLASPIAGYNIYRAQIDLEGHLRAPETRLNSTPAALPSFNDATAEPAIRYRYSVTAIDGNGNESPASSVTLAPSTP